MLLVGRWFMRDVHASLAVALSVPVLAIEAVHAFAGSAPVLGLTIGYFALQIALTLGVGYGARGAVGLARFLLAVLFVAAFELLEPRAEATLPVLYVPILVLAAATSLRAGVLVSVASAVASRLVLAIQSGPAAAVEQSILPIVVVAFLVFGTRHVVSTLERSLERLRTILAVDRRRARRMRAIEQVGRLLAQDGPSPGALEEIMDVLVGSFGYRYPSVYLWTGSTLRLGAQRGYEHPIVEIDPEVGIIGRVARTRQPVFAPDVRVDADYAEADPAVVSEISVPLLAEGDLLGVLNVESTAAEPLHRDDLASMLTIADRLAASIALGRERQKLAERAALLGRLTEAFAVLGGTLDQAPLLAAIAAAATTVVSCDVGILALVEEGGSARIAAAHGAEAIVGMKLEPGEGASGKAIATRAAVLDDHFDRTKYPTSLRQDAGEPTVAVMSVPMLRDDAVLGALTFVRSEAGHGFSEQEREIAALLAAQAALAIANAALHAETQEAAIRDPLTKLHNRRLLDDALARASAARARQAVAERRPMAAILFDLDHFGDLNNRHGHIVGDAVLRAFAGLIAGRFRASDLVARYGGEEFLVVLEGSSRDDAVHSAEQVRLAFREIAVDVPGGGVIRATVSAGCAALDPSVASMDAMIEIADVALAMAKAGGRDQVVAA